MKRMVFRMTKLKRSVMVLIVAVAAIVCAIAGVALSGTFGGLRTAQAANNVQIEGYYNSYGDFSGADLIQGGTNTAKSLKENGYKIELYDGIAISAFTVTGGQTASAASLSDIMYTSGMSIKPYYVSVCMDITITTNSTRTLEVQLRSGSSNSAFDGADARENRVIKCYEIINGSETALPAYTTASDGKATFTTKTIADCEYRFELIDETDRPVHCVEYRRIYNGEIYRGFKVEFEDRNGIIGATKMAGGLYYLPHDIAYYNPASLRNEIMSTTNNGDFYDEWVLDLNGHVLDLSRCADVEVTASNGSNITWDAARISINSSKIIIRDSSTKKEKHKFKDIGDGRWQLDPSGPYEIEGGAIVGGGGGKGNRSATSTVFQHNCGKGNNDVFIFESGTIAGCVSGSQAGANAKVKYSAILSVQGTLRMTGGVIRNCTIYSGGNAVMVTNSIVSLSNTADFEMTAGGIYDNTLYVHSNSNLSAIPGGAIGKWQEDVGENQTLPIKISGGVIEHFHITGPDAGKAAAASFSDDGTSGLRGTTALQISGGYIDGGIDIINTNNFFDASQSSVTGGYFTSADLKDYQPYIPSGYMALDLDSDPTGKHYGDAAYDAAQPIGVYRAVAGTVTSNSPVYDGKPIEEGVDFTFDGVPSGSTVTAAGATFSYTGTSKAQGTVSGNGLPTDAGDYEITADIPTYTFPDGSATTAGKVKFNITIEQLDLTNATVETNESQLIYNMGMQKVQVTSVKVGNLSIAASDYSLSGDTEGQNVPSWGYDLIVSGINNCKGSTTVNWNITPYSFENGGAVIYLDNYASPFYDGTKQTRAVSSVKLPGLGGISIASAFYKVSGTFEATNAGVYTITVTGSYNYTGSCSTTWEIRKYNLSNAVAVCNSKFTYDGNQKKVSLASIKTQGGKVLVQNVSWSWISCDPKTDAGTYEFTAGPASSQNYEGKAKGTWTIAPIDLSKATVSGGNTKFTYNGKERTPSGFTVTAAENNMVLSEGSQYTIRGSGKNAGVFDYYIEQGSDTNNFINAQTLQAEILKRDIAGATIKLKNTSYVYNGAAQTVQISAVTLNGVSGNVTYKVLGGNSGTNATTYTMTLEGTGNFQGVTTYKWTIAPKPLEQGWVKNGGGKVYDGTVVSAIQAGSVVWGSKTLQEGTDYTLSNLSLHAGTHTATITGKGNFNGNVTCKYTISPKQVNVTWKVNGVALADQTAGQTHTLTAAIAASEFVTNDRNGNVEFRIVCNQAQGTVWGNSGGAAASLGLSAEDTYLLSIEFKDKSGNADYTAAEQTFTILDNALPTTLEVNGSNIFTLDANASHMTLTFTLKAAQALPRGLSVEFTVSGSGKGTATGTYDNNGCYTATFIITTYGKYTVNATVTSSGQDRYSAPQAVTHQVDWLNEVAWTSSNYQDSGIYWGKTDVVFTAEPGYTLSNSLTGFGASITASQGGWFVFYYQNSARQVGMATVQVKLDSTAPVGHIGDGSDADLYKDTAGAGAQYWLYTGALSVTAAGEDGDSGVALVEYAFGDARGAKTAYTVVSGNIPLDASYDVLYVRVTDHVGNEAVFTASFRQYEAPAAGMVSYTKLSGGGLVLDLNGNTLDPAEQLLFDGNALTSADYTVSGTQVTVFGAYLDGLAMSKDAQIFTVEYFILPGGLDSAKVKNYASLNRNVTLNATVEKATLVAADFTFTANAHNGGFVYDGTDYTADFALKNGLAAGALTASYTRVGGGAALVTKDAGTYSVSVSAAGSKFYKAAQVTYGAWQFTVEQRDLSHDATISVSGTYTYTGMAQTPTYQVNLGGAVPITASDYSISLEDNVNAGTGKIVLTGTGNFTGICEGTFVIQKANCLSATATGYTGEYDGQSHLPALSVSGFVNGEDMAAAGGIIEYSLDGSVWTRGYTATNVADSGKIFLRVVFANYETVFADATVEITARSLADAALAVLGSYTYNGAPQTATFTAGDALLTAQDYAVSYENNVNAGTATAIVTGKGNFAGSVKLTFVIAKAAISPNVSLDGWEEGAQAGVPVISGNSGNGSTEYLYTGTTADGTAYSSTEVPTEAGEYTLTVTFAETANYLGASASVDFGISAAAHGGASAWSNILLVIIILIDCALTGIFVGLILRRREEEKEDASATPAM